MTDRHQEIIIKTVTCLHCQAFLCILFAQLNPGLSRTDEKQQA